MSTTIILAAVIVVFIFIIGAVIAGIVWRKARRSVEERYEQTRYEEYSRLVDEIVAEKPPEEMTPVTKLSGDEVVLEDLLQTKISYLKGEDHSRVAERLAAMGLIDDYVADLDSHNPVKRAHSLEVLGELRIVAVSDRFVEALADDDRDVRLTAARGLANIIEEMKATGQNGEKSKPYVKAIVSLLGEPDRWPLLRVAEIIVGLGPSAVDPLVDQLHAPRGNVRALAADILGAIGDWRVTDQLVDALGDRNTDVRARAASALGALGNNRALKPLVQALRDESWPVRARAAKALGRIGDQAAAWPLSELLKDRQWWVRHNAGYALSSLGEPGFEALERNLSNPDRYAGERSLEVLEETGRIRKLITDLSNDDAQVRNRAVTLMTAIGRVGGLAPLIDATKEARNERDKIAVIEIWREVTEHIAEALSSGNRSEELRAIESTNKIIYSFVMAKVDSFAELNIDAATTSLAEIDKNMVKIKAGVAYLARDVDPEVRGEADIALNFMERAA